MRWFCLLLGVVLMLPVSGCGPKTPPNYPLSGTVMLDGQPMAEGEISFVMLGVPPQVFPIKAGAFQGQMQAGKWPVEIRAYRPGKPIEMGGMKADVSPENYIPDRYNTNTALQAEVTSSGANKFQFEIQSK
jgi:hypothetical protein